MTQTSTSPLTSPPSPKPSPRRKHLIFVYGTLKRDLANHWILPYLDSKFLGSAITFERFPMVVEHGLPYLLPFPGEGFNIYGELYRVTTFCRQILDRLEAHPNWYVRSPIQVVIGDHYYQAEAYFLNSEAASTALSLPHINNYT